MSQYIISPTAIRDLEDISDYYGDRNLVAGERFLEDFTKKCRYLTQFPRIGRSYELNGRFAKIIVNRSATPV